MADKTEAQTAIEILESLRSYGLTLKETERVFELAMEMKREEAKTKKPPDGAALR